MRLLASGRDADVFEIGSGKVLRRYRDPAMDCTREAAVMRHVVARGFPAPTVYEVDGPDLVMDRVHGPTMFEALAVGALTPAECAAILVELLDRLHLIPAPGSLPGPSRLDARPPESGVVVHLDLHPLNVLLAPGGPVVIDWCNAASGPAGLDRALTALILAQVASGELVDVGPVGRHLFDELMLRIGPLTDVDLAVAYRSTDPNLTRLEQQGLAEAAALLGPLTRA
ncbi:phosphotransferase [Luteipulveratus flavus]|uniref:Phosphotransferase n=1 Tax=Luteipulveratus flavus TaxID=3031728 RepID=A0ABT6CCI8_9MICO|nr:phosphotransferase [Luteipulveratus sp. YIM 133296]MDF8265992.1 phosphotransferase [Luteipulveratus sp. YIM 133296]